MRKKLSFNLEGHELFDEINSKLFSTELKLMNFAIKNFKKLPSIPQSNTKTSVYPKRNPDDSELDPQKTIAEQFNLIRIADENRYPCFFYFKGQRYKLSIRKY